MTKLILFIYLFVSVLSAGDKWIEIKEYKSSPFHDKYIVNQINDGNFSENFILLTKESDDLIKNNKTYYLNRHRETENSPVIDYIGTGSIMFKKDGKELYIPLLSNKLVLSKWNLFVIRVSKIIGNKNLVKNVVYGLVAHREHDDKNIYYVEPRLLYIK